MRPSSDFSALTALGLISQLGLTVALPPVGGVLLGVYLDDRFATGRLFTLAGIAIGLVAGLWGVWRILAKEIK